MPFALADSTSEYSRALAAAPAVVWSTPDDGSAAATGAVAVAVSITTPAIDVSASIHLAAMNGADALIFTGGIGENAAVIRARICEGLGFLGVEVNDLRNMETTGIISAHGSRVTVRVIHTDEELMIARSVDRILKSTGAKKTA